MQQLLAAHLNTHQLVALPALKANVYIVAHHPQRAVGIVHQQRCVRHQFIVCVGKGVNDKLLFGHRKARRAPQGLFLGAQLQIQIEFRVAGATQFQVQHLLLTGRKLHFHNPVPEHAFITALTPIQFKISQIRKQIFIFDLHLAPHRVHGTEVHILIQLLNFVILGGDPPITEQQSVAAEMAVVGLVPKIAAVGQVFPSLVVLGENALIHPVPHKAALQTGIFIPQGGIFVRRTTRIAHGVGVLAKQVRPTVPPGQSIFFTFLGFGIHFALHIGQALLLRVAVALKVHKAGVIHIFQIAVHFLRRLAAQALIAHGPAHHAGAVLVPLIQRLNPIHTRLFPLRAGVRNLGTANDGGAVGAVAFHIVLIDHINTVLIAQLHPPGTVGIMRSAHRVHIGPLHLLQIVPHHFLGDIPTGAAVKLVAVGALKHHTPVVNTDHAVQDLHLAKAEFGRNIFNRRAVVL